MINFSSMSDQNCMGSQPINTWKYQRQWQWNTARRYTKLPEFIILGYYLIISFQSKRKPRNFHFNYLIRRDFLIRIHQEWHGWNNIQYVPELLGSRLTRIWRYATFQIWIDFNQFASRIVQCIEYTLHFCL